MIRPGIVAALIAALVLAQALALQVVDRRLAEAPAVEVAADAPVTEAALPAPRALPASEAGGSPSTEAEPASPASAAVEATAPAQPSGSTERAETTRAAGPVAPDPGPDDGFAPPAVTASTTASSAPDDPARQRFERRFPAQARATQDLARDPASGYWAVLVGVNEHQGRTRDNVTSRQDAELIRRHLLSQGWRDENIALLVDGDATREMIEQAIAWLARKTNGDSVAVFHFSGHLRSWNHHRARPDVALWPSDNNFVRADDFARRMGAVNAGRLWVNIQGCHAEGMDVPGLRREGRLLTFSSRAAEKSYEDPARGYTVLGHYMVKEGLVDRRAARDGATDVTVADAFAYAAPRVPQRTSRASHGPQHPVMVNDSGGGFSLRVPPPPREEEPEQRRECLVGLVCRP